MLSENELLYTLALQRVPNLGDTSAKKLLEHVGSAEGIFKEARHKLLKINGIGAIRLKGLSNTKLLVEAERELKFIQTNHIKIFYFRDKQYPERLKHCVDSPILIFQRGNIQLQRRPVISIVGTRNITAYGAGFCKKLIEELVPIDPVIVSGFAFGVDILAHKVAMENRLQTIACLAHGLNQIYPRIHKKYVSAMEENGGFVSEFWSDDVFDRTNFLRRNRIIAGLSEATVVIESAEKGGSLVTADIANSYNRDVFALPGRVTDSKSQGCNNLIKTQQAHLLSSAADLIFMMGWDLNHASVEPQQKKLFVELNEDEKRIYSFLVERKKELLDSIALACDMQTSKTAAVLFNMELKGVIKPLPGKWFQLN